MRIPAAELEAAQAAARSAERESGAEIVAVVVERCDGYEGAMWAAAALGSALAAALAIGARLLFESWSAPGWAWIGLPPLAGAAVGYLAALSLPGVRRVLTPSAVIERRVERRAAQALVEEEVFATRDRTGVLLMLALFERRALVRADTGVREHVAQEEWQGITDRLAAGVRAGRPGAALTEAIERCGRLLAERGVERRPDDRNELDDRVRIRER